MLSYNPSIRTRLLHTTILRISNVRLCVCMDLDAAFCCLKVSFLAILVFFWFSTHFDRMANFTVISLVGSFPWALSLPRSEIANDETKHAYQNNYFIQIVFDLVKLLLNVEYKLWI